MQKMRSSVPKMSSYVGKPTDVNQADIDGDKTGFRLGGTTTQPVRPNLNPDTRWPPIPCFLLLLAPAKDIEVLRVLGEHGAIILDFFDRHGDV